MTKHVRITWGGLLLFAGLQATTAMAVVPGYHQVKKFEIGGDGGWDILTMDSAAHRLYIARATRVMVVDTESGKLVGEVPDTPGVHGVALVPDLGRGFASVGRDSTVCIFDLKTLALTSRVKVGASPDAILFDPASRRVFVFNGGSKDATAIDAASGAVAGTVALGGTPEFGVADGAGKVFVNLEDKSEIAALDSRRLTVLSHWPLAPGEEPSGIALDVKNHRLFSACRNQQMVVTDSETGHVVTTIPIGHGVDGAAFDPEAGLLFSPNGRDSTMSVIHQDTPDKYTVIETPATQLGARTITLDPVSHLVYLVTARFSPPPAATAEQPHPRPTILPGTFVVLVMGR